MSVEEKKDENKPKNPIDTERILKLLSSENSKENFAALDEIATLCREKENREVLGPKVIPKLIPLLYKEGSKFDIKVFRAFANLTAYNKENVELIFNEGQKSFYSVNDNENIKNFDVVVLRIIKSYLELNKEDENRPKVLEKTRNFLAFLTNFFHCNKEIRMHYFTKHQMLRQLLLIVKKERTTSYAKGMDGSNDTFQILFHCLKVIVNYLSFEQQQVLPQFIKLNGVEVCIFYLISDYFINMFTKGKIYNQSLFSVCIEVLNLSVPKSITWQKDTSKLEKTQIIGLNLFAMVQDFLKIKSSSPNDLERSISHFLYVLATLNNIDPLGKFVFKTKIAEKVLSIFIEIHKIGNLDKSVAWISEKTINDMQDKILSFFTKLCFHSPNLAKMYQLDIIQKFISNGCLEKPEIERHIIRLFGYLALVGENKMIDKEFLKNFEDNKVFDYIVNCIKKKDLLLVKNSLTLLGNICRNKKLCAFSIQRNDFVIVFDMLFNIVKLMQKKAQKPKDFTPVDGLWIDNDFQRISSIVFSIYFKAYSSKNLEIFFEKGLNQLLVDMISVLSNFLNYFGLNSLFQILSDNMGSEFGKKIIETKNLLENLVSLFLKDDKQPKLRIKIIQILYLLKTSYAKEIDVMDYLLKNDYTKKLKEIMNKMNTDKAVMNEIKTDLAFQQFFKTL